MVNYYNCFASDDVAQKGFIVWVSAVASAVSPKKKTRMFDTFPPCILDHGAGRRSRRKLHKRHLIDSQHLHCLLFADPPLVRAGVSVIRASFPAIPFFT